MERFGRAGSSRRIRVALSRMPSTPPVWASAFISTSIRRGPMQRAIGVEPTALAYRLAVMVPAQDRSGFRRPTWRNRLPRRRISFGREQARYRRGGACARGDRRRPGCRSTIRHVGTCSDVRIVSYRRYSAACCFRKIVERGDDVLGERIGERRGSRADCGSGRRGRPAAPGSRRRAAARACRAAVPIPGTPTPPGPTAPRTRPRWRSRLV